MHQRGAKRARRRIVLGDAVGRARGIRAHHVTSNLRGGDEENRVEGIRVGDGGARCGDARMERAVARRVSRASGDFGSAPAPPPPPRRQCSAAGGNCAETAAEPNERSGHHRRMDDWIDAEIFEETVGVFGPAAGFGFDSDARFADQRLPPRRG